MSTNQKRLSNAISNINMNSYRAFKILMNEGKLNSIINSNKQNKKVSEKNNNSKNLTKHVFSSHSERFDWQTNPAKHKYGDLAFMTNNSKNELNFGDASNRTNYNTNRENPTWKGMLYVREDNDSKTIYNNNGQESKLPRKNTESRKGFLQFKENKDNSGKHLVEDYPISKVFKKDEYFRKKLVKSASMQDIYDKTDNNEKPFSKFTELKFPPSKIFSGLPPTPSKKGVRRTSIGHNTSLMNNRDYDNYQSHREEVHFHNLNNPGNNLRSYLNPSVNVKVVNGEKKHSLKADKYSFSRFSTRNSTNVNNSKASKNFLSSKN